MTLSAAPWYQTLSQYWDKTNDWLFDKCLDSMWYCI